MNQFNHFYSLIAKNRLSHWLETLPAHLNKWYSESLHGDFGKWERILENLPNTSPSHIKLDTKVEFGLAEDISTGHQKQIEALLKKLMPWRKGPYHIHGVHVDTEWRSDFKWDRLKNHISPLDDKYVLDIGCGSGYHLWRMRGAGAKFVVGIDPTQLFMSQFNAVKHFNPDDSVHLLPLGVEDLPALKAFETVFSMGVLYHRRSPIDFLQQLKMQLRPGGELVLETLIIEGNETDVLVPGERYAKMRNVWFIPSADALMGWMARLGFKDIKVVNIEKTDFSEQRKTDWIETESLSDFLDPNNPELTIEGYPAPLRAVFIATI